MSRENGRKPHAIHTADTAVALDQSFFNRLLGNASYHGRAVRNEMLAKVSQSEHVGNVLHDSPHGIGLSSGNSGGLTKNSNS